MPDESDGIASTGCRGGVDCPVPSCVGWSGRSSILIVLGVLAIVLVFVAVKGQAICATEPKYELGVMQRGPKFGIQICLQGWRDGTARR